MKTKLSLFVAVGVSMFTCALASAQTDPLAMARAKRTITCHEFIASLYVMPDLGHKSETVLNEYDEALISCAMDGAFPIADWRKAFWLEEEISGHLMRLCATSRKDH